MKKLFFAAFIVLLANIGLVSSHEHDFAETKKLLDSGVGCDQLTEEQLEAIGDYYMEQMHPGEAHELMDKMMGGEGSESLRQMHIAMARRLYCNEEAGGMMGSSGMMGGGMMGAGGMMGMMPMMNMMGGGMMGGQVPQTTMQGTRGAWGGFWYWDALNVLYAILLVGLIILVFLGILKLWRDLSHGKRK